MFFSCLIHKGALHIWSTETRGFLIPAEEPLSLRYSHGGVPSTDTQEFYPAQLQNCPWMLLLLGNTQDWGELAPSTASC